MPNEASISLLSELDALLAKEAGSSKARVILSSLQERLHSPDSEESTGEGDYTKSRAHALRTLAMKMKKYLSSSKEEGMTYSDRAFALSMVSDAYLKLTHAFKTDPKMWTLAQTELVPLLTTVNDEDGIDAAITSLESHLDTYLISLDSWLEK